MYSIVNIMRMTQSDSRGEVRNFSLLEIHMHDYHQKYIAQKSRVDTQ